MLVALHELLLNRLELGLLLLANLRQGRLVSRIGALFDGQQAGRNRCRLARGRQPLDHYGLDLLFGRLTLLNRGFAELSRNKRHQQEGRRDPQHSPGGRREKSKIFEG